ncbi:MAG: SPOR domain-containing protein [Chitinophagales bacterium]|nr:SPOR domain-containing protein [Chitinophagales bacterium]
MRNLFVLMGCLLFLGSVHAQTKDTVDLGNVDVIVDSRLDDLQKLYAKPIIPDGPVLIKGYRVQLGISQSRDQLTAEKDKFTKAYPEIRTYLNYEQPNFKLRVGDFKSKGEATTFMYKIRKDYPGCFVVEDVVEIKVSKPED